MYVNGGSILSLSGEGAFLLHHGGVLTYKGSPSPLECIFAWDVRGNYMCSNKSTVAGFVKRLCLGNVDSSLRGFQINVLGRGAIDDNHTSSNILLKND